MRISEKNLEKDISQLLSKYPRLNYRNFEEKELEGEIDILEADSEFNAVFQLRIIITEEYPFRYPKVFEVSNIIPKDPEWHRNSDGSLCISVEPMEIIYCRHGITMNWFFEEKLTPHLAAQLLKKEYGVDYPQGEYSHFNIGIKEALRDICEEVSFDSLRKTIKWYLNKPKISRNEICFCGSNLKFKHCHELKFKKLGLLGNTYLREKMEVLFDE